MQLFSNNDDNTEQRFKDLYYHLYSNSSSSRSERILADLSKLILVSLAASRGLCRAEVMAFTDGGGSANELLLPPLLAHFPLAVKPSETFSLDDDALRHALKILDEIDLASSPSHTFGDAFQALMGPRLRGDKGQFFTPRSVVRALVDILAPTDGMRIIDPACGTGGFLSATLDRFAANSSRGHVVGVDKDSDLALLASALSTVHLNSGSISVHSGNSLSIETLRQMGIELGTFDQVITNPPFGAKIGVTDRDILKSFELGFVWKKDENGSWKKTTLLRSSQDPQILFTELCVRLLKNGGKMGIVLPEGVFGNAGAGYIWEFLRQEGSLDALIDCPRTTFQPGTDTKTNILVFTRGEKASVPEECWVAVAYTCGHDKRGRSVKSDGSPVPDDFAKIAKDWTKPELEREIWNRTLLTDRDYLVPRYYDQNLASEVEADAHKLGSAVVSLGDLLAAGYISIRKGHEVGSDAYGTGEIPFVRTSDIHNFEISSDPTNSVSQIVYRKFKDQQNLKSGDLLMVVDGRYKIGRCAILHDWMIPCVVQSHLRIISLSKAASFSPYALLYGLSLPSVQREIRRLVFIQSTLGGLGSRIKEIRLPDPRTSSGWGEAFLSFQKAIATRAEQAAFLRNFGNEVEL